MARFVSIADRQGIASRSEGEKMEASSASTSFSQPKVSNVDTEKSNVALSQNRLGGPSMASSPPLCSEDGMAIPLQTEESKEAAKCSSSPQLSANSYKFARPRVYVKNCYESAGTSVLGHLKYISENIGPKSRTPAYNQFIDWQLKAPRPKKGKKAKPKVVSINAIDFTSPTLKLAEFSVGKSPIKALVDTGSTHCLMSVSTFRKLSNLSLTPLKVDMKVAGSVLHDNIVGYTNIDISFQTEKGPVAMQLTFLIAHAINGYEAILGATLLMNSELMVAVTPTHLCLTEEFGSASINLVNAENGIQGTLMHCENVHISPGVTKLVTAKVAAPLPTAPGTMLEARADSDAFSILECIQSSSDTVQCTVKNQSERHLFLGPTHRFGTIFGPNVGPQKVATPMQMCNMEPTSGSSNADEAWDSIDEQIIAEHQLLDPSDLDKKFHYTDCEINPNLSPKIREKLDQILFDNQTVFAKSKLDVGEFKEFEVSLIIDAEIPAEKQRFMSDEKLTYCKRTFKEFEQLGLVEQCHSPKTISNLLLVPKYEGLRDLTKASVYLAQVKGEKNSSFRIVQDLRRINAKTKNIKKASPKLPEFIFQKLKNKVVSSIDANQAYWHLRLDNESRSYTAFYLQNRTLQFCRMPQGLASAPACWDEAMSRIFSSRTMSKVKARLPQCEADLLPDSFEPIFDYYQDDSWVLSDDEESHLLHLKAVLMAYKMYDIKLSPNKCTFFPESFKILGVTLSPKSCELALSQVKAQSILDWEKPDSLYTLQSRLYALNYWMKFIPALAEIKFPLQQIVRSQVFTWNEEADLAWQRMKALIALDIRLTIPEQDEQLVITTDASKVACSCILWVYRKGSLRVVGCYSKLFSHTDSLKSIHFKETYALVLAFDHFKAYLLNTQKSVIVFTDARALMWVGRNREYSIACNGLVNKLAKIQLEMPHVVYSVPSEVNYLADIFSRAFSSSRFLDKAEFALSKTQANEVPPLTEPFLATESALYQYFALPLNPERDDKYPRRKPKISTPKPISELYKLFRDCTPEEKYLSALRLLQGWNDSSLSDEPSIESNSANVADDSGSLRLISQPPEAMDLLKAKRADLHNLYTERVMKKTLNQLYGDLDPVQQRRIEATLRENQKSLYKDNLKKVMKDDFIKFEVEKESAQNVVPDLSKDDSPVPMRYSVIRPSCFHPVKRDESPGIDIPIQDDVTVAPGGCITVDTGIQLVIPPTLCARFIPNTDSSNVDVSVHSGFVDDNGSSTIKLMLKNDSKMEMSFKAGAVLAQALILRVIHPTLVHKGEISSHSMRMSADDTLSERAHPSPYSFLNGGNENEKESEDDLDSSLLISSHGKLGSSEPIKGIELYCLPTSYLHMMLDEKFPSQMQVLEINTAITLPQEKECKLSTIAELAYIGNQLEEPLDSNVLPIPHPNPDPESLIQIYPRKLESQTVCLNSTVSTQTSGSSTDDSRANEAFDSAYNSICEKLAVVSVDLIKNGSISRSMLAQLQQGDDYLGPIRDQVGMRNDLFPKFFIKDMVLYKKYKPKHSLSERHVICLPDVLLPAVIHFLHVTLGHSSITLTKRNFEHYYYSRKAHRMIQSYVQACVTCAMAHKYDIKKAHPETNRSLQPQRPRQYLYCDLIPMPGRVFSYILFCLDAYSQFVYALALKDKTSQSVIQGLVNLSSSMGGWPEAIYLDNETSFQKAAKFLVKNSSVKMFYSVPYCQFQNWSENYIKNFKKAFSKILHDVADPHNNEDWPLLLPTVTQSLNRQVIPDIGMTRESIHYNMNIEFHPLAHLSNEDEESLSHGAQPIPSNIFKTILEKRLRNRKDSKRNPIPHFYETQIVFMRDQAPSVSSILKTPNKGPYRIERLEERNVLLIDLCTGKSVHTHVQYIRPLELSEFRLLLSKNWDLNANAQRAGMPASKPGIFDAPSNPISVEEIIRNEGMQDLPEEGDFETMFQSPAGTDTVNDTVDVPSKEIYVPPAPEPPDIVLERSPVPLRRSPRFTANEALGLFSIQPGPSNEEDKSQQETDLGEETISFNAVDLHLDLSKLYKRSLGNEPSEILDDEIQKRDETMSLPPRSALKKKKFVSFFFPAKPPYLFYPEKG